VPSGVVCKRFSWSGEPKPDLILTAQSASAARVVGERLYLADANARTIRIHDVATGKQVGSVGRDLRICCGILDCNIDPRSGDVLIGNLGAFKAQRYTAAGKLVGEFGQRGTSDGEFQGCCNPVSFAALPSGDVVTVEKEPSRVKIYAASGRLIQVLPNLEQLVEGCQRVSLSIDSKGRLYLGVNAKRHFVLQYVPAPPSA
jgi:hypothetical protein